MEKCISCNKKLSDVVRFPCPECKSEIKRCTRCRTLSLDYKCACGHKGP